MGRIMINFNGECKSPPFFPPNWYIFQQKIVLHIPPLPSLQLSCLKPNSEFLKNSVGRFPQITFLFVCFKGIASSVGCWMWKSATSLCTEVWCGFSGAWVAHVIAPLYFELSHLAHEQEREVFETQGSIKSFIPYQIQLLLKVNGSVNMVVPL